MYPCQTTTTISTTTTVAPSNVLILNTRLSDQLPVLTDLYGKIYDNFSFEIENDAHAYFSCGVQFKGNFYIYGAENDRRQIAMVSDCALKKIATLPFNHYYGACAANADRLFLCFDYHEDGKTCRMSNQPTGPFQETPKSTQTHIQTRVASNGSKLNLSVSQ